MEVPWDGRVIGIYIVTGVSWRLLGPGERGEAVGKAEPDVGYTRTLGCSMYKLSII